MIPYKNVVAHNYNLIIFETFFFGKICSVFVQYLLMFGIFSIDILLCIS